MADPFVVVGGNIASLVAADALASTGAQVQLFMPAGPIGGGFSCRHINGRVLQMGVRLIELDYGNTNSPPSMETYEPGPTGHAPFIKIVRAWIEELMDGQLFEASRPLVSYRGEVYQDIHISADLTSLPSIVGTSQAKTIAQETTHALKRFAQMGQVSIDADPWKTDLKTSSLANHGATFHSLLIEPLCRKLVPKGSSEIITALRRKVWMPLYYPKTLQEAALGQPLSYKPYRPFHVDGSGGCDELINRLHERVRSNPSIAVRTVGKLYSLTNMGNGQTRLVFDDQKVIDATRPVVGLSAEETFNAVGIAFKPERLQVHLAWVEVREDLIIQNPSTVLIGDPDLAVVRISQGGKTNPGYKLFVLELAHDAPESIEGIVRKAMSSSGIIDGDSPFEIIDGLKAPALVAPTKTMVENHRVSLAAFLDRGLEVELIGPILGPGVDSLNEQILQGLHFASRIVSTSVSKDLT